MLIKSTGTVYKGENYMEQDINVHAFGAMAKKGLGLMMGYFPQMLFNIGFCIESREEEEMPECLLGAASVNQSTEYNAPIIEISYPETERDISDSQATDVEADADGA